MTTISESGEPIVLSEECRHCGRERASGLSWFDDTNGWYFKCDECGKQMFLGYAEADNQEMVDAKRAYERAQENRARYLREKDTEAEGKIKKALESLREEPDVIQTYQYLFDPAAAVKGKEWRSDRATLDDAPTKPFHVS